MKTLQRLTLLLLTAGLTAGLFAAEPPAPAVGQRFSLPLADGTAAQAVVLSGPDGTSQLVYATSTGQLVFLPIGKQDVPPPPPPPPPGRKRVAIVEDPSRTTFAHRQILADKSWREYVANAHDFLGIIPADLIDPDTNLPPPHFAPAIAAAKNHALPCLVVLDQNNELVEATTVPASAAELLATLQRLSRKISHDTPNR
jgi:hypothetical protein